MFFIFSSIAATFSFATALIASSLPSTFESIDCFSLISFSISACDSSDKSSGVLSNACLNSLMLFNMRCFSALSIFPDDTCLSRCFSTSEILIVWRNSFAFLKSSLLTPSGFEKALIVPAIMPPPTAS